MAKALAVLRNHPNYHSGSAPLSAEPPSFLLPPRPEKAVATQGILGKQSLLSVTILLGFGIYFTFGILTLRWFFTVPEYADHYFPLRQWFVGELLHGHFPLWNPNWGLGEPFGWFLTIPLDLFTPLEMLFGPIYNVFFTLQFLALLAAAYWALTRMGMPRAIAVFGACLFAVMPSVTYYYFYFVLTNSYVVNTLLFALTPLYVFTGRRRWLCAVYATEFLGLFGTKAEYWFFNAVMFAFIAVTATAVATYSGKVPLGLTIRRLLLVGAVFGLACLSHLWQINTIYQEIRLSGRDTGWKMDVLTFLRLTVQTLITSPFLQIMSLTAPFAYALWRHRFGNGFAIVPGFAFLMAVGFLTAIVVNPSLFQPTVELARTFWNGLLIRPGALGIPIGAVAWWLLAPERSLRTLLRSGILYLPFVYYWFQPGDLLAYGEYAQILRTPVVIELLVAALVWFGMTAVGRDFWPSLAWASLFFILVLRENGQLILLLVTGNTWIVDRDSYIPQYAIAIMAAAGLNEFCGWPLVTGTARRFLSATSSAALEWTVGAGALALLVAGLWPNPYYSHPLVERTPPDYPYYRGVPGVSAAFAELKREGADRIFLINKFTKAMTYGFGEALLNGLSQVTYYSSTIPHYMLDWAFFQRYGKEVPNWVSFNGAYTPLMLRQFPAVGNPEVDKYEAYLGAIVARPIIDPGVLRLLGVTDVGYFDLSLGDETVGYHDLIDRDTVEKRWQALKLDHVRKFPVGYYVPNSPDGKPYPLQNFVVGSLRDPFPRAFVIHGLTQDARRQLREDWRASAGDGRLISFGQEYPITAATIERPSTEIVRVQVDDPQGGLLVLSDLYHPFWSATLDGAPIKIEPTMMVMRGVEVPPGSHQLVFRCQIPHGRRAVAISLISFIAGLSLFFYPGRNAPKQ